MNLREKKIIIIKSNKYSYIYSIYVYYNSMYANRYYTQKGENTGHFGWISYSVSTARVAFHNRSLSFALHETGLSGDYTSGDV